MSNLFLSTSLGSSLGDLGGFVNLLDRLDDTDSDGLSHITDGETTKRSVVSECLNTHRLRWLHGNDSSITRLDDQFLVISLLFKSLTSTTINLLLDGLELASNVCGVAIKNWSVTIRNLTRVVENDDLSIESLSGLWWIILGVTSDVTTTNFLDGNVLDVETNVVSWETLDKLLVVHLDGLDFSGDTSWGEGDDHTGLDDTGLDTSDWHRANTTNLVNILERKTEGLVCWAGRWVDGINGFEKSLSGRLSGLGLLLPSLVPWAVGGVIDHVVTVESGDWDEGNSLWVVTDLLDEGRCLLDDFLVTGLGPLGGVHLVDSDDKLLDTESVGEESVLTGLAILGDTSLELTSTGSNDENSAIGLGGTSDHVLDEITVTWGVDDGDIIFWSLELPESDIDGDTTLTLGLQFVKNPSVFERTLAQLGGFLLKLLDGTLVNSSALVDQVTGGGGLSGIDVADNDHVNVHLLLTHDGGIV